MLRNLTSLLFFLMTTCAYLGAQSLPKKIDPGIVYDSVRTILDQNESYSIYLPSNYNTNKPWPIIYIFDPLARGKHAINMFKPAAEKHGYIIVCSNNAKNGSWEPIFKSADALFAETFDRLFLDPSRVYTAGFSGGARAAVAVAVLTGKVQGVIGCGAGFPNVNAYKPSSEDDFVYLGIVGNKDMNYSEHLDVKQALDQIDLKNNLIVYEGRHQWPTNSVLEDALAWLTIQYATKVFDRPEALSMDCTKKNAMSRGGEFLDSHQNLLAIKAFQFAYDLLSPHTEVEALKTKIDSLKNSKKYVKLLKINKKVHAKELKLKEKYIKSFSELHLTRFDTTAGLKGETWWQNEIDYLKRMVKSKETQNHNLASRMLNLIWARCAESSFSYLNRGDMDMAYQLTKLWLYCEPESVWGLWSMAKIHALTGKKKESVNVLKKAVKHGLSNQKRLANETAFKSLHGEKGFQLLMQQLASSQAIN